jgi:hypothetical protein
LGLKVAAPAAVEAAPPAAAAKSEPSTTEEFPCLLSPMSGMGERALLWVRALRGGGLDAFQIIFTDEHGIVQLDRGEVSRGAYRKQMKEMKTGRVPLAVVSRDRARALLAQAAAQNLASKTPYPSGAEDALRHLEATPGTVNVEPVTIPMPDADDARNAHLGHTLHDEPEIAAWLPPEAEIKVLLERMEEVVHSPLQLSNPQKAEQLVQRAHATARDFFTPPMKQLYARRLWEMAEYFDATQRPQKAALARSEAKRLFHDDPGVSRFAEFLFEKVVVLTQRAQAGQNMPAPGARLGMEEEEAPQAPQEKRSPGGLILP